MCAQDQFEQHVRADVKLNVYLYYGSDRNRSKRFLSSQDVVITTYNVLSADFGVSVDRSHADWSEAAHEQQRWDTAQSFTWMNFSLTDGKVIIVLSFFQNKSPLHAINWFRVVLDEGHIIRNPNAQMSKAVLDLKAQRRWVLSGISAP